MISSLKFFSAIYIFIKFWRNFFLFVLHVTFRQVAFSAGIMRSKREGVHGLHIKFFSSLPALQCAQHNVYPYVVSRGPAQYNVLFCRSNKNIFELSPFTLASPWLALFKFRHLRHCLLAPCLSMQFRTICSHCYFIYVSSVRLTWSNGPSYTVSIPLLHFLLRPCNQIKQTFVQCQRLISLALLLCLFTA